jgi:hypothetical protein
LAIFRALVGYADVAFRSPGETALFVMAIHIHWKWHPVKSRSQRANLSKINATVRAFDMS